METLYDMDGRVEPRWSYNRDRKAKAEEISAVICSIQTELQVRPCLALSTCCDASSMSKKRTKSVGPSVRTTDCFYMDTGKFRCRVVVVRVVDVDAWYSSHIRSPTDM